MTIGMNRLAALPFALGVVFTFASSPHAQELTPDPGAWRPLIHADLETELPDNLTYIDIWQDALTANNQAYDAKGAPRAAGQNAPASDAHVVVRSSRSIVVLTTLDTESGCKPAELSPGAGERIKMCPTRLVIFEGALGHTRDLPASCYLEIDPATATNPNDDASYAAFDTVTKTIKIGLIANHRAVDECTRFIPTPP